MSERSNTERLPYLFTSKELDEETGLYYFGARYYDARTSVWQSTDPVLDLATSNGWVYHPENLGLYGYGRLNPLFYVDPDGRDPFGGDHIVIAKLMEQPGGDKLLGIQSVGTGIGVASGFASASEPLMAAAFVLYAGTQVRHEGDVAREAAAFVAVGAAFKLAQAAILKAAGGLAEAGQAATAGAQAARGGLKSGVPTATISSPPGTPKYARPSGAGPTAAQRASVQGKPCVDCGAVTARQVPDHIDPLVVQHYREGAVNVPAQAQPGAVQPHCPTCSSQQGGQLSAWARKQWQSMQKPAPEP